MKELQKKHRPNEKSSKFSESQKYCRFLIKFRGGEFQSPAMAQCQMCAKCKTSKNVMFVEVFSNQRLTFIWEKENSVS